MDWIASPKKYVEFITCLCRCNQNKMKSYCIWGGPSSSDFCLYKKRNIWTQTHRRGHVKTGAEIGVVHPQAKEHQVSPSTTRTKDVWWGPVDTLISDFEPPERWDNTFLVFFLSLFMLFVGLCYSKPRKLTHPFARVMSLKTGVLISEFIMAIVSVTIF